MSARKREAPTGGESKERLRLWIQMLRTTRAIESSLRDSLRSGHAATLPQFDVLAALYRFPDGMLMSELSRYLMVSNGNVTGIVNRLVEDGHVERTQRGSDRRTSVVRLSPAGQTHFETMAADHERRVNLLLNDFTGRDAALLARRLKMVSSEIRSTS